MLLCFWSFNAIDGNASLQKWFLATPPLETNWQYERVKMALAVKTFTDQQATIAVFAAGAIPYFSKRPAIDLLGKCDAKIAHEPARIHAGDPEYKSEFTGFHPGHMKRDYAYSIGELKPDLLVEPPMYPSEIEPYLQKFYQKVQFGSHQIYCLRGSSHILWNKLQPSETGTQ